VTESNPLVRQRRTFTAAFFAAAGAFTLGVLLPISLGSKQGSQSLTLGKSQPSKTIPEVVLLQDSIAQRVEGSQSAIEKIEQRFNVLIPERFQGTIVSQAKLPSQKKVIALTFDDGPWPESTMQILDVLKKNNIKATFFWVGRYLQANPALGKKVVAQGHAIGNHSWSHQYYKYNEEGASREIERTSALIQEQTGVKVSMFRPPGGILTNGLVDYAQKKKYAIIMWSVDSLDWRSSAESLLENVLRQANGGGIVLMHDGGGNRSKTVTSLPKILDELKKKGYEFVTVPELLAIQDQEMISTQKKPATTTAEPPH
jgi:peptidoglycan/xylan/chitin deacetylase (PgdA/CDA1 family)